MRTLLKSIVPLWIRKLRHGPAGFDYLRAYEDQAKHNDDRTVIGDGDYDAIGRMQLDLLKRNGLHPQHTLVDFGCGNGRLATHAIPYLNGGQYVGIDHCSEFLRRAEARLGSRAKWIRQTSFEFPPLRADMLCAFSVFTHMEHEDAFRYLKSAREAVKPGGTMVFSCLPLDQKLARDLFEYEAGESLAVRWSRVRNVVTSRDLMAAIATMAGWRVEQWLDGDAPVFQGPDGPMTFGQSACTLRNPG